MRNVTYSMSMSLDGYIVGPDGDFDWPGLSEEVFRLSIDEIKTVGVHLMGRRLYETMLYWETPEQQENFDDIEREWASLWNPLPKIVFSRTLTEVEGSSRLASGSLVEEIERLRAEPGDGDIAIGGANARGQKRPSTRADRRVPHPHLPRAGRVAATPSSPATSASSTSNWSRRAPSTPASSSSATASSADCRPGRSGAEWTQMRAPSAVEARRKTYLRPLSGFGGGGAAAPGRQRQPSPGATCCTTDSSSLALKSTPNWFGTVMRRVSASATAASSANCSMRASGSPM
jgi:dihydrofolate reductase